MEKLNQALLIIDAQVNMLQDSNPVYQAERIKATLLQLLERARSEQVAVIFVRNNGGAGAPDQPGSPGWQIHPDFTVVASDAVINKDFPDAFKGTDLQEKLARRGIRSLVLAGMQSEYCIDATSRRAVELGYAVTVVEDGHSTYDSDQMSAAETIQQVNQGLESIARVVKAGGIVF